MEGREGIHRGHRHITADDSASGTKHMYGEPSYPEVICVLLTPALGSALFMSAN